jgi:aminoglycoside/choline kinase family phosphotransferase
LVAASLRLASADASFRRYFRLDGAASAQDAAEGSNSHIIMDAPPALENTQAFVDVAGLMQKAGLTVPQILDWDQANGFLLMTDLGQHTLMQVMDKTNPQANFERYMQAVDTLITWQLASKPGVLPPYDEAVLRRELALFPDWYLAQHKGVVLQGEDRAILDKAFDDIVAHNLAWPCVYVHRDFMPRNLMVPLDGLPPKLDATTLGVLDFQDAVYGPITYDIASLMRDAFLSWDESFCLDVTIRYWEKARKAGLPVGDDFGEFYRGVEWMGLQRHLKIAGIFARLTLRDGKPKYLADTPRFIDYIRSTCGRYMQLKPLLRLVENIEGIEMPPVFAFGRS